MPADFGFEQLDFVRESQRHIGEHDRRAELRRQGPFLPGESQLAEQLGEGAVAGALRHDIGDRVQIPEGEYTELASMGSTVRYLEPRMKDK